MNLGTLKKIYRDHGCERLYFKRLAANDNSKNQVYFGGNFEVLNMFPVSNIISESSATGSKDRFKATLNFFWLNDNGERSRAPHARLILYPQYPEVRFSGFLKQCKHAPSALMRERIPNRLLFLGTNSKGEITGYVTTPDSELSREIDSLEYLEPSGVFLSIPLTKSSDYKNELLSRLKEIHQSGWVDARRLNNKGEILPCNAPNCGGYTLEALLGIIPNGISEPDFLGWEIKQFGVQRFDKIYNKVITLMTPEPTGGIYKEAGVDSFLQLYGYKDKSGIIDRINFGGIHKAWEKHKNTNLTLTLVGFDRENEKIMHSDGRIALLDEQENEAASWSFESLLKHWNRKHNKACYVPSLSQKAPHRKYYFGNKLILGIGTDFILFLKALNKQHIYYDPGIKMENTLNKPRIKRRSQFRIKSGFVKNLYKFSEEPEI
ncbi:MAG: MvaI/BcnI restriction endonuclease family protein [Bacteroidetes bacterium]|nr:MAG: MvaI/BcnI restriction endonuclease family protein [Bacteroidota bacterium]